MNGVARAAAAGLIAAVAACWGGCSAPKQYSQTALLALETREFDEGFDRVFDNAVGALFDLGYTIQSSDKRGGFVKGSGVQLKIDAVGPRRTSVRVSTSHHGQVRVDKKRIDEVLNRIEQRLATTGAPPPAATAPSAGKAAGR